MNMIEIRELKPTLKRIGKNKIVTLTEDPIIFEDMAGSIRSPRYRKAYEDGLILTRQCEECRFVYIDAASELTDYVIIDSWVDKDYGELYLIYTADGLYNCDGLAFITTRACIIPVEYNVIEVPEKKVIVSKDRKDRDVLVLIDEDNNSVKVTRDTEDKYDIEKGVLYAICKMYDIPRSEILEYLDKARLASKEVSQTTSNCKKDKCTTCKCGK